MSPRNEERIFYDKLMIMSYHFCGLNSTLNALCGQEPATKDIKARPTLDYDLLKEFTFLYEDSKKNVD